MNGERRRLAVAAAIALAAGALAAATRAETLSDAIRLAYQSNPELRGQRAAARAVGEAYVQARAALGPQVRVDAQGGYSVARVQSGGSIFSGTADTTYAGATGTGDLSIVQPILSFGANSAKVRGARDDALAARLAVRQSEAEVISKVIAAYVGVRRDRKVIQILTDELSNLSHEVSETQSKGELGQLTRTDVAEAQSRLLQAQAQLDQARSRLVISSAEYLEVVGENPGILDPEPDLPGAPATIDDAFTAADHNNPELLAALQDEAAARERINEAKASYGPTLSLRVDAGVQPIEPYLPNLYDRNVTVAGVLSQPLFTSGMRASKVREAVDRDDEAVLKAETMRRAVVRSVASAWSSLSAAVAAEARISAEVDADRIAVEGNQLEERVGRRSIFELLSAETELTNARVDLLQQQTDKYRAKAALLAATGLLEARNLTPGLETYDDAAPLDRHAGGVPWASAVEGVDSLLAPKAVQPAVTPSGAGGRRPVIADDGPPDPAP